MVPNAQYHQRIRMFGIADDVIPEHHVADDIWLRSLADGATRLRERAKSR